MKRSVVLITIAMTLLTGRSVAQNESYEASVYMQEVGQKAMELQEETWQYLKAVTRGKKASKVEAKRRDLTKAIKTAQLATARKKDYKGSTTYRDAIVNYLDLNYIVLKEEYDKILDMEAIAEESYDAMEAYILAKEKSNEKLDSSFQILLNAQDAFAAQYEITLNQDGNKKSEQIKKASETLSYYNDIYLIFFKSYKQEAYVLDAISRADVSSIEQNNSTLKLFVDEGLNELRALKSYKGDASLNSETRKVLMFYKDEANNDFEAVTDFFLKKDEFDKLNKKIENMSKKDRTQAVIDKYNQALKEYNAASDNYNKSMQETFNRRQKVITDWNNKVDHFISNHSR